MKEEKVQYDESCALLVTKTLTKFFSAEYVLDLENRTFTEVIASEQFRKVASVITDYTNILEIVAKTYIEENQKQKLYEYFNIDTLQTRLSGKQYIKQDFKTVHGGWFRAFLMTAEISDQGAIRKVLFCSQDITDEKEKELKIKQKEKRYDELYGILCHDYDCCFYVTVDSNIAIPYKITDELEKVYGFHSLKPMQYDEAAKLYIENAVHPEDKPALYEILDPGWLHKNLSNSGTVDRTYRVNVNGSYRYWQVRIAKSFDHEQFTIVIGFGDVDEKMREEMSQKRALENAYEEAMQLRRGLLSDNSYLFNINLSEDLIDEDVIAYSEVGEISLLKLVDLEAPCSFNEFAKRSTKLLAQEYNDTYKQIESCESLLKSYNSGKESVSIVFGIYTADRKKIKIVRQTFVFYKANETGNIMCTCFAKDITDSIEENAILSREHKQYRDALMAQAEFEYKFDLTEGIMSEGYVTKRGLNIFKTIGVEAPISFDDYASTKKRVLKEKTLDKTKDKYWTSAGLLEAYNRGERNVEIEYYREFEDRYFRISFLMSQQNISDHISVIAIGRDITEERKKEEKDKQKLTKALENAKKANYAKTTFLTQMSHDIRTPLNGIIGLIEIDRRHPNDIELIKENRDKALVAAQHLLSLINDVLEISKLDSENVKIQHEAFDIRQLMSDIMTITEMRALESDIKLINMNTSEDYTSPFIYGSPLHLRQIFLNIFGNSIKYNNPGGTVSGKMEVISNDHNRIIYRYTISDTGIGMSNEFIHKIFEPFSQEHTDARSVYQGTGLGMTIAKRLIEKMKGTIQVRSEIGVGSTFVLTILFDIAQESDVEKPKELTGNIEIKDAKILLVEDNELNMEIAQYLLEEAGAKITSVFDGKQAVEAFENNPPGTFDVILMDVMMPVMNGYEATHKIRNSVRPDAKTIPIFAMTANAFEEDMEKAKKVGMDEHLTKPLDYNIVLQTIAKYL